MAKSKQEEMEEYLASVKEEFDVKNFELTRLRNQHEREKVHRDHEATKINEDYEQLCYLITSNGLNVEKALKGEIPEERKKREKILQVKHEIACANAKIQEKLKGYHKAQSVHEKEEADFEQIKLMFSSNAKDPLFRSKAAEFGINFTKKITKNGKRMYVPDFNNDYKKLLEIYEKKMEHIK